MYKYDIKISSTTSSQKLRANIEQIKSKIGKKLKLYVETNNVLKIITTTNIENMNIFLQQINKDLKIQNEETILAKEYQQLQTLKEDKNFKFIEKITTKLLSNLLKKEYGIKKIFSSENSFYLEGTNVIKEEDPTKIYITKTSKWYNDQKKMLNAEGIEDEKKLIENLGTNSYQKRLMGDYIIDVSLNEGEEKKLSLFDVKNYEGLPVTFYKQKTDLEKVFNQKIDIKESFSKTSEPNIQLLEIFNENFFKKYILKKIEQKLSKTTEFQKSTLTKKEYIKEEIYSNLLEEKDNIITFSKEYFENVENDIEPLTLEIKNDFLLYEIIKVFEKGYLNTLYSLNGYEIEKKLISVNRDKKSELITKIKKINLKQMKRDLEKNENKIVIEKVNGYLHVTIFSNNEPIYNFSFRKQKEGKQKMESNATIVNNKYVIVEQVFSQEETLDLMHKPSLYFPKNKSLELIELIKQETLDLSVSNTTLDTILNKYLQKHEEKLRNLFKTYSQIPEDPNKKTSNFYNYGFLRKMIIHRLKQDINPYFTKLLEENNFTRIKIKGETTFSFNGTFEELELAKIERDKTRRKRKESKRKPGN